MKLDKIANVLDVTIDSLLIDSLNKFNTNKYNNMPKSLYNFKIHKLLLNLNDTQMEILNQFLDYKFENY